MNIDKNLSQFNITPSIIWCLINKTKMKGKIDEITHVTLKSETTDSINMYLSIQSDCRSHMGLTMNKSNLLKLIRSSKLESIFE